MAKKAMSKLQKGDGRTFSKVIKMVKSPKTGAYIFKEEMVPNEMVKEYVKKQYFLSTLNDTSKGELIISKGKYKSGNCEANTDLTSLNIGKSLKGYDATF